MPEKELTPITGAIELPVDEETYEAQSVGSRYVETPGDYEVEMGMPMWVDPGRSMAFPFVITEAGPETGKEARINAGINAEAFWKVKELAQACGIAVSMVKGKDGKKHPKFDPAAFAGTKCIIRFVNEPSIKDPNRMIVVPKSARALKSTVEETN